MGLVLNHFDKQDIFSRPYPFYSLIEVASNNDPDVDSQDSERLLEFIDAVSDHIHDGVVPQGE